MSRLEITISGRTLFSTGDVKLWAELPLSLKDNAGLWHQDSFRVDTGTELTTFPAYEAKQLGLPIPLRANPGATHTQTGLEIRSGVLRFRVVGLGPDEYSIACLFLGDPNCPPDPSRPEPRKLLQPFQLLDWFRFFADKDPAIGSLHGELVLEKK